MRFFNTEDPNRPDDYDHLPSLRWNLAEVRVPVDRKPGPSRVLVEIEACRHINANSHDSLIN